MNLEKGFFWNLESDVNKKRKEYLITWGWREVESLIWEKDGERKLFLDAYKKCKRENDEESKIKPPEFWKEEGYIPKNLPSRFNGFYQDNMISDSSDLVRIAKDNPICIWDIECYKNYFCIGFLFPSVGKYLILENKEGVKLNVELAKWIARKFTLVGFNSSRYDNLMLSAACSLPHDEFFNSKLKAITNSSIISEMRDGDIAREYGFTVQNKLRHIDLMQIAPQSGSLKIYSGRAGAKCVMDLPFHPDVTLTDDQMRITALYCLNDLDSTNHLAKSLDNLINLRIKMGAKFNLDLLSSSDAGIAKKVICGAVKKSTGIWPKPPQINPFTFTFKYDPPKYITFKTDNMRRIFRSILNSNFGVSHAKKVLMPEVIANEVISIGNTNYNLGIGGLHSMEKSVAHNSDDDYDLEDWDVESYYPRIILNNNYSPSHIGQSFQSIYKGVVDRRLSAKAAAKEFEKNDDLGSDYEDACTSRDALKIVINSSFGQFGDPYSPLFDPKFLIQVTLTGQLSLLMLIEVLEYGGISVVSANTDGIVIKVPKHKRKLADGLIEKWQEITQFKLEKSSYLRLCSRDVNNYIAFYEGGSVKRKGVYAEPNLSKNQANAIVAEAVVNYIKDEKPIQDTITGCKDISKFLILRKVTGGALTAKYDGEFLGRVVRFYYSTETSEVLVYAKSGNKVPMSDGAVCVQELPDDLPSDIDFQRYISLAENTLIDLGVTYDIPF